MAVSGSTRRRGARLRLSLVILAGTVLGAGPTHGQPVEEYQFKAAIIYNLTKFVEWPPEVLKSPTDSIAICILGESPIAGALQRAVHGNQIEDRSLVLRQVSDAQQASRCQILFVPSARTRWRSVLNDLKASGVLTVGEADGFASDGGVVNLKTDGVKVRIQVNVEAAQREGIKISSKLLSLAQIVKK